MSARRSEIAKTVISELESFGQKSKSPDDATPRGRVTGTADEISIARSRHEVLQSQRYLQEEPFVAYVKAIVDGKEQVYLVCRNYTPFRIEPATPGAQFVNYKSPVGRVAALPPGEEEEITVAGRTRRVTVREKDLFTPRKAAEWDAVNNQFVFDDETEFIESLRRMLAEEVVYVSPTGVSIEDFEFEIPDDFEPQGEAFPGSLAARIVENFSLRDRPILDEIQDSFFRLPITSQLILTGAPGTGKTTVVIKRLAQKSRTEQLTPEELDGLDESQVDALFGMADNWVMFTPTELLKGYLKEAISKESLAANDSTVKTWFTERTTLARDVLKILKVGDQGRFAKCEDGILREGSGAGLVRYLETFAGYYHARAWGDATADLGALEGAVSKLSESRVKGEGVERRLSQLVGRLSSVRRRIGDRRAAENGDRLHALFERLHEMQHDADELEKVLSQRVREVRNGLLRGKGRMVEQVKSAMPVREGENPTAAQLQQRALRVIGGALRWAARKRAGVDASSEDSAYAAYWPVISTHLSDGEQETVADPLAQLEGALAALRTAGWCFGGYARAAARAPQYYDGFRRSILRDDRQAFLNRDYEEQIRGRKISACEIDVLTFLMLKEVRDVFRRNGRFLYNDSGDELLEAVKSAYRTQVVADEATDFSAIQLGCMYFLSHPRFSSVSFVGDLMQRVTAEGIGSWDECRYISDRFEVKELGRAYRQSPKLLSVAADLYRRFIGMEPPFHSPFAADGQDPPPLKFRAADGIVLGEWLVERVLEVYKLNDNRLPSIAVFVPAESAIEGVYSAIAAPLNEHSIEVEKCFDGRILGTSAKVRIFSVEHIKGLEFGAVFLVGVDEIHAKSPDLVDKYLYVAFTRATTFLGITYQSSLPETVRFIENHFEEGGWARDQASIRIPDKLI